MLLSLIVFLPLLGAIAALVAGGRGDRPEREGTVRTIALVTSLVTFAATLYLWWQFDPANAGVLTALARSLDDPNRITRVTTAPRSSQFTRGR